MGLVILHESRLTAILYDSTTGLNYGQPHPLFMDSEEVGGWVGINTHVRTYRARAAFPAPVFRVSGINNDLYVRWDFDIFAAR